MAPKKQLGQILLEEGLLDEFQLKSALGYQKKWGGQLGKVLVDNHFVTEEALVKAVHKQTGVAIVDLTRLEIPDYLLRLVPLELANRYNLIPVRLDGAAGTSNEVLVLAMSDPTNLEALDEVRFRTGKRTAPVLAGEGKIQSAIRRWYLNEKPEEFTAGEPVHRPEVSLTDGPAEQEMVVVRGTLESPPVQSFSGDFDSDDPFAQLESLAEEKPAHTAVTPTNALAAPPAAPTAPQATPAAPPVAAAGPVPPAPASPPEATTAPELVQPVAEDLPELEVIDVAEPEDLQPDPVDAAAGSSGASDVAGPADRAGMAARNMNELLSRVGLAIPPAAGQPANPAPAKTEPLRPGPAEPASPTPGSAQPVPPPAPAAPGRAVAPVPPQPVQPPVPTDSEVAQLLARLEGEQDESALPQIVRPSNMVAAVIRLLLGRGVFTEAELLDELKRQ